MPSIDARTLAMKPRAILKQHSNSYPFEERTLDLTCLIKVGRAVAKCKPLDDNAIFDCKVLSRNHAVIWFEKGRFFIKDTCSSNGTFINNNRLNPANDESPGREIHSNDIVQFGVEVVNSVSKITHGCIIMRIKLFYPDGSEASRTPSMFNIPTANMLPPYYSYTQMVEREQQINQKLSAIEDILEEAHLLADLSLHAKKEKEQLEKQLDNLQSVCDEKTKYAHWLEGEAERLREELEKENLSHMEDCETIRSLEARLRREQLDAGHLQKKLDRLVRRDHRLVTAQVLLLIIVLVMGSFDMIAMFTRLLT